MAETLTYDPGSDTVTQGDNLTPDEQESLQVGEEMQKQEGELLAGKYKNAEELEKAYAELEKKLGDQGTESTEAEPDTESKAETTDEPQYYLEDGAVNYDTVNEAYGDKLGEVFKESNVDPWAISEHFHNNNGTITDEMYSSLEGAGLSRGSIDAYLAGRSAESGYTQTAESVDMSDADITTIRNAAGGESEYNKLTQWAANNLDTNSIQGYDSLLETGNLNAIKLALSGIKAQYDEANGYEGRMLTGKSTKSGGDVFKSQAQLVEAMADPRYDRDPAYRQDVIEKLDRSDVQF